MSNLILQSTERKKSDYLTYDEIRQDEAVNTYIRQADASLAALGFTEHSFAHVTLVAEKAGYILQTLGYP